MCLEDPWFESRLDKSYGLMFCTQSGLFSWGANFCYFVVNTQVTKFSTHEFYDWTRALHIQCRANWVIY